MEYDLSQYPYSSQRRAVLGKNCAVATSQSLATLAGMEMFWAGGNAVDAAIASAIAITVVEPTSNGIGGDAFALVWDGKLYGLNGSGKSPQAMSLECFAGLESIPELSWLTVTVPGAVSAWQTLGQRWGKLPFERLFAPAIRYAKEGFPVSPVTAAAWKRAEQVYLPLSAPHFTPFKQVFFPQGRAPNAGEIWASPNHAQTLEEIAVSGGESFYRGKLAQAIAEFAEETGGLLSATDLANHQSLWVEPISTPYRQYRIWEIPPNTQGIAALMALNILEGFDLASVPRETVSSYHQQIEAMKLAFADVYCHVGDSDFMNVSCQQLLDKAYAAQRRQLIQHQALHLAKSGLASGGTVYLAAADRNLMVSLIQSNYKGFGCGIVVPGTGIALHNRGTGFTLEKGHPNQVAPGKRPFHTIIPGFITEGDRPLGSFGVMGASMQPQGHLQVLLNLIDYGMNPQAALDAPRWRFVSDNQVLVESGVSPALVQVLRERGHDIQFAPHTMFGKGQIILSHGEGLVAATEPRADGIALAQ
ncbi:gamma-glutamyltransferase family protein [Myxosarcina sp. GI1]|uniref:gamma-glutamyltransferase family protein n=1 Tax=Myxosarcina sp. GI1 TaxID=1541065 RepID=UPI00055CD2F6